MYVLLFLTVQPFGWMDFRARHVRTPNIFQPGIHSQVSLYTIIASFA